MKRLGLGLAAAVPALFIAGAAWRKFRPRSKEVPVEDPRFLYDA